MPPLILAGFVVLVASGVSAFLLSYMKPGVKRVLLMLVLFTFLLIALGDWFDPSSGSDVDYAYNLAASWIGWPAGVALTIFFLSLFDRKKIDN